MVKETVVVFAGFALLQAIKKPDSDRTRKIMSDFGELFSALISLSVVIVILVLIVIAVKFFIYQLSIIPPIYIPGDALWSYNQEAGAEQHIQKCLGAIQERTISTYENCFEEFTPFPTAIVAGKLGKFEDINVTLINVVSEKSSLRVMPLGREDPLLQAEFLLTGTWYSLESGNIITINRRLRVVPSKADIGLRKIVEINVPILLWKIRSEDLHKLPFDFSSSQSDEPFTYIPPIWR